MDYLNYGNKVQQKPQGFGQEKVQLTKDDFSFGDLNQQTTPPPPSSQEKDELMKVFPTPVLICKGPIDYSREKKWCIDYECTKLNNSQIEHYNRQSKDTFILDNPELKLIREYIEQKINIFAGQILSYSDKLVITQSWLNKSGKGEFHQKHSHPNSIISGIWYPLINKNLPPIQFDNYRTPQVEMGVKNGGYNTFNSTHLTVPMNEGELILFPSTLPHSVSANKTDDERISLSFNTWCKGSIGDKETLTYLPFDKLM
tara:strand:+ start:66 stop:836 length:771 start_codon:yes stop_codon:yes gene_type:complete